MARRKSCRSVARLGSLSRTRITASRFPPADGRKPMDAQSTCRAGSYCLLHGRLHSYPHGNARGVPTAIEISHPDKALFPDGLTKADLARYYERVAATMLPHVRGRPVHMQRYPDGIDGEEIQQKQAPGYLPAFVERAEVPRKRGGSVSHVVIENAETLVYLF